MRYDIYDEAYPAPSPTELALQSPHVLHTPPAIARRLGKRTFALWSDASRSTRYLSTARTTIRLGGEDASKLHFYDIAPAGGGGYGDQDDIVVGSRCLDLDEECRGSARGAARHRD